MIQRVKRRWLPPLAVWGFLLPNIVGFLMFTLLPVVLSFLMAFTNWTLKPAVKLEYLGLRNFSDLLGFQPKVAGVEDLGVSAGYIAFGVLFVVAFVAFIWGALRGWKGARTAGALLALLGAVTVVLACAHRADHGFILAGLTALIFGVAAMLAEKTTWGWGLGAAPGVVMWLAAIGLWLMNAQMWKVYEAADPRFWRFFYNTLYLMLGIPFSISGSLALALLLDNKLPTGPARSRIIGCALCVVCGGVTMALVWVLGNPNLGLLAGVLWLLAGLGLAFNIVAFRTVFYLPTFTSGVAIMILWKCLYNPQIGPINTGLAALTGADIAAMPKWLASYVWSKPALMFMSIWIAIGGTNMLLYLAALSNVPQDLLDAAAIDGAGAWQRLRHIILPQLAPTTFFICVMSVIGGLQSGFDEARVMTNGGPDGATTTLTFYIYGKAFQDLDLGYAAAISWAMFLLIFIATAINWRFGKELEVA